MLPDAPKRASFGRVKSPRLLPFPFPVAIGSETRTPLPAETQNRARGGRGGTAVPTHHTQTYVGIPWGGGGRLARCTYIPLSEADEKPAVQLSAR